MEKLSSDMLHYDHEMAEEILVRHNYIYSQENWLPMFGEHKDKFFDISRTIKTEADIAHHHINFMDKILFQSKFFLDMQSINHNRSIYNLLDLLGDLGGVTEVIMAVLGIFLFPISEHSFIIKAAKIVFLAKTKDENMFKHKEKYQTKES